MRECHGNWSRLHYTRLACKGLDARDNRHLICPVHTEREEIASTLLWHLDLNQDADTLRILPPLETIGPGLLQRTSDLRLLDSIRDDLLPSHQSRHVPPDLMLSAKHPVPRR